MNTKTYKQAFVVLAVSIFIVPQIALAAWWNPLSWSVWNFFKPTPHAQVQIATTTTAASTVPATTTTKITNESAVKKSNTSLPKIVSSKYPLFSTATDLFFTTPNPATLKEVCEQAKSVPTGDTKDVLSTDKLTMQKVPYTLYDEFKEMCDLIDRDDIKIGNATPDAFSMTLSNDDSDSVRIAKLKQNDFIKIPNSYAVFYLYSADSEEKKYISDNLVVSCPPDAERVRATDEATHAIYAPMIFLLGELSSSRMVDILGIGLSEKGKSRLSKVGVGWKQKIPFYRICF